METKTQLPACSVVRCAVRTVMWCGSSGMFGVLISIFLLYLDFASVSTRIKRSNSGCIKQWQWLPHRCPRPLPRHSAKKLDRFSFFPPLRAHCQRHSAATFVVSAFAKAESRSIFAECRGVAAADATFSAPNGIVCGRLYCLKVYDFVAECRLQ